MAVVARFKNETNDAARSKSRAGARSRYHSHKFRPEWFENAADALNAKRPVAHVRPDPGSQPSFDGRAGVDFALAERINSLAGRKSLGGLFCVTAYAADRVVLTATREPGPSQKLPTKLAKWKAEAKRVLRLEPHTESRRALKIGGRWRKTPLKTKFTNWAKNFVKDAAHLIERDVAGQGCFLTLTFPGHCDAALEVLKKASPYLVDRFNRWIRGKVQDGEYVYVWEQHKTGFPHLHYLFRVAKDANLEHVSDACKSEWHKILLDVTEQTAVDMFERANGKSWILDSQKPFVSTRPVHFGLASYISKYISKSRSKGGAKRQWWPGRWWACSARLRVSVLASRLRVKIVLPSQREAESFLATTLKLAEDLLTGPFICDPVLTHGALVVSVNTPVGVSKRVAQSLMQWLGCGDVTEFLSLVDEYRVKGVPPDPVSLLQRPGG